MLRDRMNAGSNTVTGDERTQIRGIAECWQAFYRACVRSALLPPENVWFVCEDYIYTAQNTYAGDSAGISTALIWGVEGYRLGTADEWDRAHRGSQRKRQKMPAMVLQTASQAKGFATNARLKEWDVWVVGREHERSAWQHIAYFLKRYAIQHTK